MNGDGPALTFEYAEPLRPDVDGMTATAADFSPTCHALGEHGDLFRCHECGTVQQPSLPDTGELHDLYRSIDDDAYLVEEEGRRASARRLLDLIGRYRPAGRLLDVGCGYGLLLDEARRRAPRRRAGRGEPARARVRKRHPLGRG